MLLSSAGGLHLHHHYLDPKVQKAPSSASHTLEHSLQFKSLHCLETSTKGDSFHIVLSLDLGLGEPRQVLGQAKSNSCRGSSAKSAISTTPDVFAVSAGRAASRTWLSWQPRQVLGQLQGQQHLTCSQSVWAELLRELGEVGRVKT